ncbi:MAG: preprotein translocase subunit SecY [Candidatus Paceibacterota bacterium]
MLKTLFAFFKSPELRKKAFIIFLLLLVFRLMATIPLPNIDKQQLNVFFEKYQVFGLFNIFTGGAFKNISIVLLGVGPYITASIIMQLLTLIFPSLKEMLYKGTSKERARFMQYSRMLTIPLAFLQGFSFLTLLSRQGVIVFHSQWDFLTDIIIITASSIFLMWLGELITEQKLGNGISFLIFSGIVINLPREILATILTTSLTNILNVVLFFVLFILIVISVVYISLAERRIPVNYAKQVRGTKIYGGAATYLPLKINQAGVIPIIFALSILMFPQMFIYLFSKIDNPFLLKLINFINNFNQGNIWYLISYFLLVFIFTYFYTFITFEPDTIAENLQKRGGFIPGYRPGMTTVKFLSQVTSRITLFGAIFLGLIAVLPILLQRFTGITTMAVGGTSLLIMVQVAIEIMKAIESQLIMREYEIY